ncbi:MAG: lysine--tRNA ligase [Candidatus Omnitrophica bacterium]|nr:lysine--tRNA ligase [Candidatus Omnitrophota bacterium]
MEINEIIEQRKDKFNSLQAKGIPAYTKADASGVQIQEAVSNFQEGRRLSLSGRVVAKRLHGKAAFLDLRDVSGKIQLYFKEGILGQEQFGLLELIDVADFLGVQGELFKTHTGEPTVKVESFTVLAKALRPLPEKWHGLKDVELRYRQRYLDLIANEVVRTVFAMRSRIVKSIRDFLDARGFQEVETPMMHAIPGGAAGRPFKTHHNQYDMELYLRIAPELYLKRLLVGGLDRVYEVNRNFRNEGVSTRHNPEFTMLEVYQAYGDYETMMLLVEQMFSFIAMQLWGKTQFSYQGTTIDFAPPWQRRSFAQMVQERFEIRAQDDAETMLRKLQAKGIAREKNRLSRSQVTKIIEDILEQDMQSAPTFVTDYFTSLCPLARTKKDDPFLSERFELYIAGMEIGNAYSELNDPIEQRRRFEEEIKDLETDEKKAVDEDYVAALEHGMPPAGGLGIGIDRLVMLLADQPSIRDVILFPLLRPEGQHTP